MLRCQQWLIILQECRKLCLVTSNFSCFLKINQNFKGRIRENQSQNQSLSVQFIHLLSFPIVPKLRGCPIGAFKLRINFISLQREFFQRKKKKRQRNTMCMSNIFSQKIFHFFERKIFLIQVIWLFRSKNNPIVFCFSANINFLSTVKTNKW